MTRDSLDYDQIMDGAMRGVIREVLRRVAARGLPGQHHFYITFRTGAPGVAMPDYLRERHPDEMTIVLQHQYWGLHVSDDSFAVSVSFNKARESLTVPFAAITAFADPSVQLGLQFGRGRVAGAPVDAGGKPAEGSAASALLPKSGEVVSLDAFRKK